MSRSRYRGLVVLLMDVCLIFFFNFAMFFSYLTDGNIQLYNLVMHIGLLTVCVLVFQLWFKTYDTLWRYCRKPGISYAAQGHGLRLFAVLRGKYNTRHQLHLDKRGAQGHGACAYKHAYHSLFVPRVQAQGGKRWYGRAALHRHNRPGSAGVALLGELNDNVYGTYKPYCLIDDSREKQRKRIHGVSVIGPIDNTVELLANTPVTDIILAINNTTTERKREILDICANTRCRVHILGDPVTQVEGGVSGKKSLSSGMREVQIEDLLGREPIRLDNQRVNEFVRGKVVLVTGGGGSIGSELCRQIAAQGPKRLIILDIAENTTYELQNDIVHLYGRDFPLSVEIASVRDKARMEQIFAKYRPQLVLHAAAHKHVPLMEDCPGEAIKNNVFGTYNAACTAREFGAEKFVLISTDKAVNPTNVMGATKCLCEQVLQSLNGGETEFAAVRFGNVLGSNGSVIPLFKKQIAYGGPVTITDRRIIRYFMTIPEAAQLVLEAGSFAHRGEVFVLDMGEPVRIADLADKLIRLSGYVPGRDIEIKEVGLRPGEKLYEELLMSNDNLHKTENEKIFVEERPAVDEEMMKRRLDELKATVALGNNEEILAALHKLVPTFRRPEEVNKNAEQVSAQCAKAKCCSVGVAI